MPPRLRLKAFDGLQVPRTRRARTFLTGKAEYTGSHDRPLLDHTVPQHFASMVSRFGDRKAVVSHHQRTTLTYHDLNTRSNAVARGLLQRGVSKGDRIAVSLGNNVEFATLTYAIFKLGAILVPLNPAFNAPQIISALEHLGARHLIIGVETHVPYKQARSNIELLRTTIFPGSGTTQPPSLKQVILVNNSSGRVTGEDVEDFEDYEDLHGDQSGDDISDTTLTPDDVVNIQFTSGTTSAPKAACLTHRSILNNGYFIGERMLLTPEDIICCPPPLFHCFGAVLGYMATATHGSAIVFPSEVFSPSAALDAVQAHSCTALYGVPTMFLAELDLLSSEVVGRTGLGQLRTGIAAGSSVPAELMRKLHRTLNLTQLTICYGMTETSPVSCMTTTTDPLQKRIDTVGRLLPHVSAKVVSPLDPDETLATGQRGELLVSGYLVMRGYWGDPARTAEVLHVDPHGIRWMRTGDEASIDPEGYVRITGRLKDLIIRGGENIHPLEVESCLLALDGVSEVSVVGLPDERHGEVVAAFVVRTARPSPPTPALDPPPSDSPSPAPSPQAPTPDSASPTPVLDETAVRAWVAEKLSRHLVPKHVFWVDGFPKTPSGKIMKYRLREIGVELLQAALQRSDVSN